MEEKKKKRKTKNWSDDDDGDEGRYAKANWGGSLCESKPYWGGRFWEGVCGAKKGNTEFVSRSLLEAGTSVRPCT